MLVYRVLESETTIALFGAGLDPGLGIFHLDQDRRSSLALDAIEAVRPYVDCWLAARLADARFTRRGFVELQGGEIRVTRPLTSHLAMSASIWRQATTSVAGWVAQSLGRGAGARRGIDGITILVPQSLSQPLTQSGRVLPLPAPLPAFFAPSRARRPLFFKNDPIPRTCHECRQGAPASSRQILF